MSGKAENLSAFSDASAPDVAPDRVTLGDVRGSFDRGRVAEPWVLANVFRPIADLLTPAFYNAGLSGNVVTGLRALMAFLAVFGLLTGVAGLVPVILAFIYIGFVLDCVDGNIVRIRNSASYWGKFADGLADGVFVFLAPFAAGMGAWIATGSDALLVLGALVTLVALAAQMTRNRLSFFREWMISQSGPIDDTVLEEVAGARKLEERALAIMVTVSFVAPLVLMAPNGFAVFVVCVALTQMPADLVVLGTTLSQANKMLRRWRRSSRAKA